MARIEDLREAKVGDVVDIEDYGLNLKVKVLRSSYCSNNPCLFCALFERCNDPSICTELGRLDGEEVYFKVL